MDDVAFGDDIIAALEPHLAEGVLADVRAQVDELFESDDAPGLAPLIVLEERIDAAIHRLES